MLDSLSTPEAENLEPAKHAEADLEKGGCLQKKSVMLIFCLIAI